jgi:hypothetical protein
MTFLAMNPVDVSSLLQIRLRSDFSRLIGSGQTGEDQTIEEDQSSRSTPIHPSNCTASTAGVQKTQFSPTPKIISVRNLRGRI